jgi:hypothetical protein
MTKLPHGRGCTGSARLHKGFGMYSVLMQMFIVTILLREHQASTLVVLFVQCSNVHLHGQHSNVHFHDQFLRSNGIDLRKPRQV